MKWFLLSKKEQVLKLQFQLCEKKIFLHKEKHNQKKRLEKIFQDVKRCLSLGSDVMENLTTFCAFLPFPNVLQLNIFAFFFFLNK